MRLRFLVIFGLVVGLTLGLGLATFLGDTSEGDADDADDVEVLDEGATTSPELQVERADAFLGDWERFRTNEALVVSNFTRTTSDGQVLETNQILAQRPGDRLTRSLSGVVGYLGGVEVFCATPPNVDDGTELECRDVVDGKSIDEALQDELATLAALLEGDVPIYRIFETAERCWELLLTTETFDAPFGESSVYCFDDVTGTLENSETTFNNGLVENITAADVRTEVTDDDLLALLNEPPRG